MIKETGIKVGVPWDAYAKKPLDPRLACGWGDPIGGGFFHVWEDGKCVKKMSDIHGRAIDSFQPAVMPTPPPKPIAPRRRTQGRTFLLGAGVALVSVFLLRGILK